MSKVSDLPPGDYHIAVKFAGFKAGNPIQQAQMRTCGFVEGRTYHVMRVFRCAAGLTEHFVYVQLKEFSKGSFIADFFELSEEAGEDVQQDESYKVAYLSAPNYQVSVVVTTADGEFVADCGIKGCEAAEGNARLVAAALNAYKSKNTPGESDERETAQ